MLKTNKKLHKLLTVKRPLEEEIDDPRLLPNAIKEKTYLFDQLQYLKDERQKITYNMEKYNAEKTAFKEYMREELLKIKDDFKISQEYENIIKDVKMKQEIYQTKINSIKAGVEQFRELAQIARARIKSYQPYEALVSKVVQSNIRYENVFDVIKHVEEMAYIRRLGIKLKISNSDEEQKNENDYKKGGKFRKTELQLNTDFNDARTYLSELKEADLKYIKNISKITTDPGVNISFNRINASYLKNDQEKMEDKCIDLELRIPEQQIKDKQKETQLVISSILHRYMELYVQNNENLPEKLPTTEDQLIYIFEWYKETMKRLDMCINLESGKMTVKDYIFEDTE